MPTTDTQQQRLVLIRIGDHSGNTPVAGAIEALWGMFEHKRMIPRLQFLYTLREAISMVQASIVAGDYVEYNIKNDALDDKTKYYQMLYDNTQAEIDQAERKAGASRIGMVGQPTTTAPILPGDDPRTIGAPDANDRAYKGDAYLSNLPDPYRPY